jgi:5'(3')-deoxyribonucleotidase
MAGFSQGPRLFLDCDGVLADFDRSARELLGMSPKQFIARHGRGTFWKRLAGARNFYGSLPEMPDARLLFDAVKHLEPTILTGLPLGKWAAPQKMEWAAEHFPGVPIITCMAADKHKHMHPGDVLVDDREKHREAYEAAGVVFVHHRNAEDSLRQLAKLFPSVRAPESAGLAVRRRP